MRAACRLGDEALERVMRRGRDWLGRTESEFFAALAYEMSSLGLAEPGACVCAGKNAADPHHTAGGDRIGPGCLLVDFGGTFRGYWTDMTRTFWFRRAGRGVQGCLRHRPRGKRRRRRRRKARRPAVRRGRRREGRDRARRGTASISSTARPRRRPGRPREPQRRPAGADRNPPQHGLLHRARHLPPRKFGVRIEDLVLITPTGPEALHHYPKELREY